MKKYSFEKIVNHVRNVGFVFQGSEIYGGLANTWDYGPLGTELKKNIKAAWWKKFVQELPFIVGLDSAILMNPEVWKASGHLATFSDPLLDCKNCKARFRADKLIEDKFPEVNAGGMSSDEMRAFIDEKGINCPTCGSHDFTDIRKFNLMFKTFQGVVEDNKSTVYLRPETAQGILINFKNIQRVTRKKLPFGVAQIGKSFRNEITPGNFIYRTREFEQMELEFFCMPGENMKWYQFWKDYCMNWLLDFNISKNNLRFRDHSVEELSHYSTATSDIEYLFPFGWGELWGIADRGNYDLSQHMLHSKVNLEYLDQESNTKMIPNVIEPSVGCDRLLLMLLCDAYDEEEVKEGDMRTIMRIHPILAPIKVCVMPLSKQLKDAANDVFTNLSKKFMCEYDESGSIGKRYRRQDAIGTPLCVTYDFDSDNDQAVTVRDRDTMEQKRIKISELENYIDAVLSY